MSKIGSPDLIIETSHLTRRFKHMVAVNHLDLKVPAGSVYGFLGPNGAGKTTTIRMLLGLIRPNGGEVRLFRAPFTSSRQEILSRVGALVEMPSLYPHLTGLENLEVTRRILNTPVEALPRTLAMVGLDKDANRLVRTYSLGMRQRLGLAMALFHQPSLLILDEPTNGLDPAGIHEMRELIRRLPQEYGITVFLSSHLLSEVEQMATHIGIINQGMLAFQGRLEDLQAQRAPMLMLGVDRPQIALDLLKQEGWNARARDDAQILVQVNGNSDVAMINALLVNHKLNVFSLRVDQLSLEDIFLRLTRAEENDAHPYRKNGLNPVPLSLRS
jgi:ABC-2 type transport system ATP-binding protein